MSQEPQAGEGRARVSDPCLGQALCGCFTALLCRSPTFVACFAPSQPPKGTEHLATMVHDPRPQTYTEGLVAGVRALAVKRECQGPRNHPAGSPGDAHPAF